ncbi:phosphatase PAP2 family protein [Agromyces binzhouensis]|uniref:Phosphatase PAP2 family protein n=1 Tax=Agromyces binzhouensis TaxID=1817495 RepID=A0A4V1QQP9_9MICO|nr:phosphatase PAP2 family protein [Agromyces binzhouensis]RXZ39751.1 phosphatase PAP2 family protein [Agromyces binzhouensis]
MSDPDSAQPAAGRTSADDDGGGGGRTSAEVTERGPVDATGESLHPAARAKRTEHVGRFVPFAAGIAALVIALVLGIVVALRGLFEIDEEWAEDIFTLRGPIGDLFAYGMNALGGGVIGVLVVPITITVILLVVRRPWAALYFVTASAASALIVQLLKNLFGRSRPEDIIVLSDFGSFPSGHVANAATIAVTIGIIVPRGWVWFWGVVYTVLMAISRTYLGAHWITDTIGGAMVGAGAALLVWTVFAQRMERERLTRAAEIAERNRAFAASHVTPPAVPRA